MATLPFIVLLLAVTIHRTLGDDHDHSHDGDHGNGGHGDHDDVKQWPDYSGILNLNDFHKIEDPSLFLKEIFNKYGREGVITFEGFEHLLQSLGIGHVQISDHDIHDHHVKNQFVEFHDDHVHADSNHENLTHSNRSHGHSELDNDAHGSHEEVYGASTYDYNIGETPDEENTQQSQEEHHRDEYNAHDSHEDHGVRTHDSHEDHDVRTHDSHEGHADRPDDSHEDHGVRTHDSHEDHNDHDSHEENDDLPHDSHEENDDRPHDSHEGHDDRPHDSHEGHGDRPHDSHEGHDDGPHDLHDGGHGDDGPHDSHDGHGDDRPHDSNEIHNDDQTHDSHAYTHDSHEGHGDDQTHDSHEGHGDAHTHDSHEGHGDDQTHDSHEGHGDAHTHDSHEEHSNRTHESHAEHDVHAYDAQNGSDVNAPDALKGDHDRHRDRAEPSTYLLDPAGSGEILMDINEMLPTTEGWLHAQTTRRDDANGISGVKDLGSDDLREMSRAPESRQRREAGHNHPDNNPTRKCLSPREILSAYQIESSAGINEESFLHLCPAIVYQIDVHACSAEEYATHLRQLLHEHRDRHCQDYHSDEHHHGHGNVTVEKVGLWDFTKIPTKVWGFAVLAVTVISLVGLVAVAIVPVMQKVFFDQLLQFLVAMAVGSLTGDALLHLLPHALDGGHGGGDEHNHGDDGGSGHGTEGVLKGLTVLIGIYFFFLMERFMEFCSEWRSNRRKKIDIYKPEAKKVDRLQEDIGEKLSRYDLQRMSQDLELHVMLPENSNTTHDEEKYYIAERSPEEKADHGHGHGHGHSHGDGAIPQTVGAMAWMVIMGDGLHNFSDGLAIGAAFSNSISGGLSTSVAVFCHELPHELGDFAVLLRAGMSVKQAIFYNVISSVLCFVGLLIGIAIGNIDSASAWIFAVVAGMFIYIALVDMLPEITKSSSRGNKCRNLLLQLLGFTVGSGIMLLIALYEHKIVVNLGS